MMRSALLRTAVCGWLPLAVLLPGTAEAHAGAHRPEGLMYDPQPSDLRVPAPPEVRLEQKSMKALQASVSVNFIAGGATSYFGDHCTAWTTQAKAAFNYAAGIWASQLQSPVPITINACYADDLGAGILGAAGPRSFRSNFSGAPATNTYYPIALANSLSGSDLDPANADIEASFSSTFNWYYGTDGFVPAGKLDFVSVVLHEIGHGLGFTGSMDVTGGTGTWGSGTSFPFVYDRFTENGAGQSLIDTAIFPKGSAALAAALQGNSVFFDGTRTNSGNGGSRAPLYAPSSWNDGSSYSHLAESFNNTPNALMTFALSSGESIHDPGPVTLGMMRDMGWVLQSSSTADVALTQTVGPNPASAGKDVVFTMAAGNNGPGTATGVTVTATYDSAATVIWASPGCVKQAGAAKYTCTVGVLGNGASAQFKLVLRRATAGSISNNAAVTSATADPNLANNNPTSAVSVNTSSPGAPVLRYRLYSPVTLEHHFTTDFNEYSVLGASGAWVQEGTVGKVLNNPGSFNGVAAVPYYRLYNTTTRWHHWTTDANEYYTLIASPAWNGEGVDGYILPAPAAGSMQLYRLRYSDGTGLHHWTVDANEYTTLTATYGWVGEGGGGYVIQ